MTGNAKPPIAPQDPQRAKRYNRIRLALFLTQSVTSLAAAIWFALSGRSARLRTTIDAKVPDRRLTAPVYLSVTSVAAWALALPLSFGRDLVVERSFNLTKQTERAWASDQVKGLAVNLAIGTPLATGAFAVIRKRPHDWWFVLASATVPISVVFARLAPVLLMPLFNRFEEIDEMDLTARIRALAARAGVEIAAVYRMDMSRQTEKPNAFFTGLGKSKRIVLSDTLIDRFESDEIEGVVAHELGHQVHGDIWRMVALASATTYAVAFLTHRLAPPVIARLSTRSGLERLDDVAATPILASIATLLGAVAVPFNAAVSRAIERRTDRFAVRLTGNPNAYARALERLAARSLTDPHPSRVVVLCLYSHPPLAERVAEAKQLAASDTGLSVTRADPRRACKMR